MSEIAELGALEILDSRGNPTLAVTVTLANGMTATANRLLEIERELGNKARYAGTSIYDRWKKPVRA